MAAISRCLSASECQWRRGRHTGHAAGCVDFLLISQLQTNLALANWNVEAILFTYLFDFIFNHVACICFAAPIRKWTMMSRPFTWPPRRGTWRCSSFWCLKLAARSMCAHATAWHRFMPLHKWAAWIASNGWWVCQTGQTVAKICNCQMCQKWGQQQAKLNSFAARKAHGLQLAGWLVLVLVTDRTTNGSRSLARLSPGLCNLSSSLAFAANQIPTPD